MFDNRVQVNAILPLFYLLEQLLRNDLQFWDRSDCLIQVKRHAKRICARDYVENACTELFNKIEN